MDITAPSITCSSPLKAYTWLSLFCWAMMPMQFAMAPTCLASTRTCVLLLGSWKMASSQASIPAMVPCIVVQEDMVLLMPIGPSSKACSHTILLAVYSICQAFSLPSGTVTLGFNNCGVLSQLHYPKETSPAPTSMLTCSGFARPSSSVSQNRSNLYMYMATKTLSHPSRLWTT